ncbi:hypothetical protein JKP88DRAFT_311124 [Tribonema minus]|uniref:EGF-like domain-containing protein n=1 Tax=Tribonema minus TaxID=303371 RepID=A0A836CHV5_9STRA|nr:hypothetical protein JKP88DRAFT_311124 [Tribonema minus]
MRRVLGLVSVAGSLSSAAGNAGCSLRNFCNGHGTCNTGAKECICDMGWGHSSEVTAGDISPDCDERTCPTGRAWASLPLPDGHPIQECSGVGTCDRTTGACACPRGYSGSACQRLGCAGDASCGGHGRCMSMRQLGLTHAAAPLLGADTVYGSSAAAAWDADKLWACLCDSSWPVGIGAGETQASEWFGPACTQRRCPSGDDPMTSADETDCTGKTTPYVAATATGEAGNLCHVDCSNRGTCNYGTGVCKCYPGFSGHNCGQLTTAPG